MFSQKTKIILCSKNLTGIEYDLSSVDFSTLDLAGNSSAGSVGDTNVNISNFSTNVPTGCVITLADGEVYYVVTGGSSSVITVSPPISAAAAVGGAVTIIPYFDITQYCTRVTNLIQRGEFNQAELVFDRQISFELFNKNSVFYDRDTHSTGWSLTTAYFSTYNEQNSTDNQYVKILINRNGTGYKQKYNGKIVRHSFELDEINRTVSFYTESVIYTLSDSLVSEISNLYNLHKYTSSTRKTKTPSGLYVDVIKTLFHITGIRDKSYSVTYKEKSLSNSTCTITTSASHNVIAGELITVSISDLNFDGTHIVFSVTSNTITYLNAKNPYDYVKDDVAGAVLAGNTSVDVQVGFTPTTQYTYVGKCKFAGHNTIYTFWNDDGNTITVNPALTSNIALNEDVFFSYPTYVSSTAASGTVTTHRIYFDNYFGVASDYFNVTHQGHSYNLLDLFWITEKWMVQDVEAEKGIDLLKDICLQLGAIANIDYISGVAYGFFRSKTNTSSSKITFTSDKFIGNPKTRSNWQFISKDGVLVQSDVRYWYEQSLLSEFCYTEDLSDSTNNFRFLSETPTPPVLAYERYSNTLNADSFNNIVVGDKLLIREDNTIYTVTNVSGEVITVNPPLSKSVPLGDTFCKLTEKIISLKYANCFNIKLKYPNIFLTDETSRVFKKYYNNATATLGIHPLSYYTSETVGSDTSGTNGIRGIAFVKNIPCGDGYMTLSNGDVLAYVVYTTAGAGTSAVKSYKSKSALPNEGKYDLLTGQVNGINRLCHGYVQARNKDTNAVELHNIFVADWLSLAGLDIQVQRLVVDMPANGVEATAREVVVKEVSRRHISGSPYGKIVIVKGSTSNTTFANEFGYYKLEYQTFDGVFYKTGGAAPGIIGTGSTVFSLFLNHDVLNPDYDDMVYCDANHASCIKKATTFSPTTASDVFTGTPPTAGTVRNFIVNHGEDANQTYYWYDSSGTRIKQNKGAGWSDATNVTSSVPTHTIAKWDVHTDLGISTPDPIELFKAYDNILIAMDATNTRLYIIDMDNSRVHGIEDNTGVSSMSHINIQCFTNWYDNQGAASPTIFENDICANASKLAYKFYSKNRRVMECQSTDTQLGYLDYTLFDRVTVDSSILSNSSGSPKFYVYGYEFDWETHEQKLTLLESVE